MKSGILYSSSNKQASGQLDVANLIIKLKTLAWGLRNAGLSLIFFTFLGVFWLYLPLAYYQIKYQMSNIKFQISNKIPERVNWDVPDRNYSIYIPKIQAISKVIPNISLINEKEYSDALKIGVAEAAGLSHPNQPGITYLFAHSTNSPLNFARYNAVFYLLDKLRVGDEIQIMYKNKLYKYKISNTQILSANDTRYLIQDLSEQKLVLQTCYPPGTSWKRFVVVGKISS